MGKGFHLKTSEFDYLLPPELIAQTPVEHRDQSRLMVLDRADQSITHDCFANLGEYLHAGDLLVANRSKVIPARVAARRYTGGRVELLLERRLDSGVWRVLARPSHKLRAGDTLEIGDTELRAHLAHYYGDGEWLVRFSGCDDIDDALFRVGRIPLPPYIHSTSGLDERYQTIYADQEGSVAAPTAGLHFTSALLESLRRRAVRFETVTLHVGVGTFRPVKAAEVENHNMRSEWGEISQSAAQAINSAFAERRRIIAVGTTTTRLLESSAPQGEVLPVQGETDAYIYPGYKFRVIAGLITNFHLPRSTLLMLVSAFAGRDYVLRAYAEAIDRRYRFYSFGDAMLIL